MISKNKKGLSGIIVTIMMILLVIAAIAILWLVIRNFIQEGTGTMNVATECLNVDLVITSAADNSGEVTVRVQRAGTSQINFTEARVIVEHTGGSTPADITSNELEFSGQSVIKTVNVNPNTPTVARAVAYVGQTVCATSEDKQV